MKAVVNACYQSQMANDPNGARMLYADPTFVECREIVEQELPRRSGRLGQQTTRAMREHHMRKQVQRMSPIQEEINLEDSSVVSSLASGSQATTVTHISS